MAASRLFAQGGRARTGFSAPPAAGYAAPPPDWQAPLAEEQAAGSMMPDLPPSAPPSAAVGEDDPGLPVPPLSNTAAKPQTRQPIVSRGRDMKVELFVWMQSHLFPQ